MSDMQQTDDKDKTRGQDNPPLPCVSHHDKAYRVGGALPLTCQVGVAGDCLELLHRICLRTHQHAGVAGAMGYM